jgi:hypothetical protein
MKNAEDFHKRTWLSTCRQTKIPTTIPYLKYPECSSCLRPCPNKDRHHDTRQCNEYAIYSAPSKKVQCNSCKLIEKVQHVNHTYCNYCWATFNLTSQNFLGELVDGYDTLKSILRLSLLETATYMRGKLPIIKPIQLQKLQNGASFTYVRARFHMMQKSYSENDCELSSARQPSFELDRSYITEITTCNC